MLKNNIPSGKLEDKWKNQVFESSLINPANRKKFSIIIVGSGLAGASAASALAEAGYQVKLFCLQDSPRRAHSIAAQGGINSAKNYKNDGDSIYRFFYDTVKGGDYRAREAGVYRLAELSLNVIDHCVGIGVPFAREYGGYLDNRSFGGTQVERTFYAKGQTGQQLLLGAYQGVMRQINEKNIIMHTRKEMLDLVIIDGKARGIIVRDLLSGEIESHCSDAVILGTGGYANLFYLSTNAKPSNGTAIWRAYKKGAAFANPCFTQIHPTCIPISGDHQSKLTLMSESLRNDGRIWVPKNLNDKRVPAEINEIDRDYFLERNYPNFGNLVPRDVAARSIKRICDDGFGVGSSGLSVYLDFKDKVSSLGKAYLEEKYGNLFQMYEKIVGDDPFKSPMRIYPAVHYTMGGLWVDYNLMSSIPGLFVLGEANFSEHGANRLGANALLQGLVDGYFIIPITLGNYLAHSNLKPVENNNSDFQEAKNIVNKSTQNLININGSKLADDFHEKLGKLMWDSCAMARSKEKLEFSLKEIKKIKDEFWNDLKLPQAANTMNQELEKAARVGDYIELAELMCFDALAREESCGSHFREEYQTENGDPKRNDKNFSHIAAWKYNGNKKSPERIIEELVFEYCRPTQRDYR
ncbi:fumarate reductase/succinate dehydrogenase flavoprotein subunit [Fluviispira multicolorata]|uniref:succinate dehydrogenase n=1 Tax=Fluviispira multicolorata TaxID=2654512 RepID=A0A833JBV7_9BACT|nr:fumarate reductase/succinate dehydrogenase flavoprotein subunit [Fluviispira multicolorata]KAB8029833.1 succinate dehydrogenase (quinone) flavoprotein subunit [Fluviispira multicolorata]